MSKNKVAPTRPYIVTVENGLATQQALQTLEKSMDGILKIDLVEALSIRDAAAHPDEARGNLMIIRHPSQPSCAIAHRMTAYDGPAEMIRKQEPFRLHEPKSFLIETDNLEEAVISFIGVMAMLEAGEFSKAQQLTTQRPEPDFVWLGAAANMWSGDYKKAFDGFGQISSAEEPGPLFESAFVNAAVSLLEMTRQGYGAGEDDMLVEKAHAWLEGFAESMDPEEEEALAGMVHFHLGRATAIIGGGLQMAASSYRKALEAAPGISIYAEAACALNLATIMSEMAISGKAASEVNLAEAGRLLDKALGVYTKEGFLAKWARAQALRGAVLTTWAQEVSGKDRVEKLATSVEAYTLAVEVLEKSSDKAEWMQGTLGLCGSLVGLGASIGGQKGLGFVDEAISMIDALEPEFTLAMEQGGSEGLQLARAGALMVRKQIDK